MAANKSSTAKPVIPAPKIETLELLNTEIADRLSRLNEDSGRVENKAGALAGFAVAAVSLLAKAHPAHPLIAWIAGALYLAAIAAAVMALVLRTHADFSPRAVLDLYAEGEKLQALSGLVATRVSIFERNDEVHLRKAKSWRWSLSLLLGALLLSGVSVVQTGGHADTAPPPNHVSPSGFTATSTRGS